MGDTRAAMHSRDASYLELNGGFEMKKSNYFAPLLLTATILGSSGTVSLTSEARTSANASTWRTARSVTGSRERAMALLQECSIRESPI